MNEVMLFSFSQKRKAFRSTMYAQRRFKTNGLSELGLPLSLSVEALPKKY